MYFSIILHISICCCKITKKPKKNRYIFFGSFFTFFGFCCFYDLNALGFCPRLFCTKREKCDGDEKSNM